MWQLRRQLPGVLLNFPLSIGNPIKRKEKVRGKPFASVFSSGNRPQVGTYCKRTDGFLHGGSGSGPCFGGICAYRFTFFTVFAPPAWYGRKKGIAPCAAGAYFTTGDSDGDCLVAAPKAYIQNFQPACCVTNVYFTAPNFPMAI